MCRRDLALEAEPGEEEVELVPPELIASIEDCERYSYAYVDLYQGDWVLLTLTSVCFRSR